MGRFLRVLDGSLFRNRVIARAACLGTNVFGLLHGRHAGRRLINQQKMRIDLWMELVRGARPPDALAVKPFMHREDVYPLIEQQEQRPWLGARRFDYLLMDSFAELTDQRFRHRRDGWSFCCHFSDLKTDGGFNEVFENQGLLPLAALEPAYAEFFEWFEREHPGKPVYYLHFPTALDKRELFKNRAIELLRVLRRFEEKKGYIRNVMVHESHVSGVTGDSFPYHFSDSTNGRFLSELKSRMVLP